MANETYDVNQGEDYEYSGDHFAQGGEAAAASAEDSVDMKRKIALGIAIVVLVAIVFKFYGFLQAERAKHASKSTEVTSTIPTMSSEVPVDSATATATMPDFNASNNAAQNNATNMPLVAAEAPAPSVSPSSSAIDTGDAAAAASAVSASQLDALSQTVGQIQSQVDQLQDAVDSLTSNVSAISDTLANVNSAVTQIATITEQQQQARLAVQAKQMAAKQSTVTTSRVNYYVQAVIPGRAWLRDDNGNTLTVVAGSQLSGYGTITAIDPDTGAVTTSSGTVLQYALGEDH